MTPPRVLAAAGVSAGGNPGKDVGASLRGASGTPPPTGCPGMGGRGEPAPHPALRGHLPPRGKARAVWRQRKVSRGVGDTAPYGLPGNGRQGGACPSSGPAGPPSPEGEGKGCCWRQREAAAGWGHPALRMGIWKRPRGLRGHPFTGRRTVGAGHARPAGLRGQASMVRSVGRGLDPSAGVGGSGSLRGW